MSASKQQTPSIRRQVLETAVSAIQQELNAGKLSIQRALQGRQLSYYRRETSMDDLRILISAWILDMAGAFNIGKNITEEQAADLAQAILTDFWHLKLAELPVFFTKAKTGYYGKVYDRLDQAIVYEWLVRYTEERQMVIESAATHPSKKPAADDLVDTGAKIMEGLRKIDSPEYPYEQVAPPIKDKGLGFNDPAYRKFYLEYEMSKQQQEEATTEE